jgi:hypothetical protein
MKMRENQRGGSMMQRRVPWLFTVVVSGAVVFGMVGAQEEPPVPGKTLASTMEVYVFPTEAQTAEQQSTDEAACYTWAVQNTGNDPFKLAKKAEEQKQQTAAEKEQAKKAGKGAGASGAVKGAAMGALIGEIASDDPGKGAAYGAAAGAVSGRRARRRAQQSATAQAEQKGQQAQAATADELENFKKAFTVCLEAKKYLAKY